ncbi:MAG: hypothetical protein KIG36_00845 [Eubacteriales bacterium]|nr:hypothetical protein [Eubacteriales bacterium]
MRCALLGSDVGNSYSGILHGFLGQYRYELLSVDEAEARRLLLSEDYDGLNVTRPYKRLAARLCDELSETARQTGTVNTVVIRNGKRFGYNTDVIGMKYMLDEAGIVLKEKEALVLGTGATASTAEYVIRNAGGRVLGKVSRRGKLNYDTMRSLRPQVLINATPMGGYPYEDVCADYASVIPGLEGYAEVAYNPLCSAELFSAKKRAICAHGSVMLAAQAEASAALFENREFSGTAVREALYGLRKSLRNIVLVGMPGSGKTTIGRHISERSGMPFFDTDEEIRERTGLSASEWIERRGVEAFREEESRIVRELGNRVHGAVIATGGGVPTRRENIIELKHFGLIFYIEREVADLEKGGRPLSAGDLPRLFEERKSAYLACADAKERNADAAETAAAVLARYKEMLKEGEI